MFGLPAAPSTLLIVRIVPKRDTEWITIETMIKTLEPNLTDQVSRQSQREKQSVLSEKESRQLLLGLDAVNAFDRCARNTTAIAVVEIVIIVPRNHIRDVDGVRHCRQKPESISRNSFSKFLGASSASVWGETSDSPTKANLSPRPQRIVVVGM